MSETNFYEKMSGEFGDFLVSKVNSNVLSFDYVNRNDFLDVFLTMTSLFQFKNVELIFNMSIRLYQFVCVHQCPAIYNASIVLLKNGKITTYHLRTAKILLI